jgi:hypothetical protein
MRLRIGPRQQPRDDGRGKGGRERTASAGGPAPDPLRVLHATRLVVDVGDRADAWRNSAIEAERAFRHWMQSPHAQRRDSAAAYLAAIDREERAASEYLRAWEACCITVP